MWSYGKRLSPNQYRWGTNYTPIDEDWIADDVYAELAAAADALYELQREMVTQSQMQHLEQVDQYVQTYGTAEAEQMLGEIFKNKHWHNKIKLLQYTTLTTQERTHDYR